MDRSSTRIVRTLAGLGLALAAAYAPIQPVAAQTDQTARKWTELRAALADINSGNGFHYELGEIEFLPPMTGIARARGNRIQLSPVALSLFQDRAGARALAAVLVTYVGNPAPAVEHGKPSKVAEYVAALGVLAAGSAADPDKSRGVNIADPQFNEVSHDEDGPKRGANLVSILSKGQGCTGPLVDLLEKAALAPARDPATSQLVVLARKAKRDLGRSIYPPDNSCRTAE